MDALQGARNYLEQYQHRINMDNFHGDLEARTRYENAAYQEAMAYAAIAQAAAAERQAAALERIAELLGNEAKERQAERLEAAFGDYRGINVPGPMQDGDRQDAPSRLGMDY